MCIVVIFTDLFKITIEHDGNESVNIPVDGSGRVSVMDIGNDTDNENGLLCQYRTRRTSPGKQRRWELNGVDIPRDVVDNETSHNGWISKVLVSAPILKMLLQRTRDETAREGFFTCYYSNKRSTVVGVFYPSE